MMMMWGWIQGVELATFRSLTKLVTKGFLNDNDAWSVFKQDNSSPADHN